MPASNIVKKTLVLGATTNPERYAHIAVRKLKQYGHEVVPVGIHEGEIDGIAIQQGTPELLDVHTVTLYIGEARQPAYYEYIFSLNPKRIIFNPGAENRELKRMAEARGIETVEGCTLVMLSIGVY
jgi:uncharacterized protein